jgi:hypothetical protein
MVKLFLLIHFSDLLTDLWVDIASPMPICPTLYILNGTGKEKSTGHYMYCFGKYTDTVSENGCPNFSICHAKLKVRDKNSK